ncbi:MAG: hypothetical protein ACT4PL_05450 [Phycisphaerales bacterium]
MGFDFSAIKDRAAFIKIGLASAAIFIAVCMIGYYVFASRPKVVSVDTTATSFKANLQNKFEYEEFIGVRISESEDHSQVLIEGTVKNAAELAKLKGLVDNCEPKVQVDFKVTVK